MLALSLFFTMTHPAMQIHSQTSTLPVTPREGLGHGFGSAVCFCVAALFERRGTEASKKLRLKAVEDVNDVFLNC